MPVAKGKTSKSKGAGRKTPAKKSTTTKKKTASSTSAKKTTSSAKSNVTPISSARTTAIKEALTQTQQLEAIVEMTGLTKKEIKSVIEAQEMLIMRCIKKGSIGQINLPIGLKIEVKVKPARKARKGINPFTGEETMFKAKPASRAVKIKALKKIKDAAN